MKLFPSAHATHPNWAMAAGLVVAQLRAQMALPQYAANPTLALLYITDHYASQAQAILEYLRNELAEVTDWVGTVGVGVCASGVEYFDEPAVSVMLCDLPADQYRVFSGVAPLGLGFEPHTALIHADGHTPDLTELIEEMAGRTESGYVFGGLAASRSESVQFAAGGDGFMRGQGLSKGVFHGGLSGVAFTQEVSLISRVTQGCLPVSAARTVTEADRNLVITLDGKPALDVLLNDLQVSLSEPQTALEKVRNTLVGLTRHDASSEPGFMARAGHFGEEVMVRHIVGLDPQRRAVAVADLVQDGSSLAFCRRDVQAARADLMRICAEIREELEPEELPLTTDGAEPIAAQATKAVPPELNGQTRPILGAVYVSCSGRGGPHFGGASAELQIVRRALGDVPLVGFFAAGEIAHQQLYGYTGVLTVFTAP